MADDDLPTSGNTAPRGEPAPAPGRPPAPTARGMQGAPATPGALGAAGTGVLTKHGTRAAAGADLERGAAADHAAQRGAPWQRRLLIAALILAALNLRPAITSLGALLEEVRDGLGMSGTTAGMLTSMPALCFAVFGLTAPRLARRWGPAAVVCAGLAAIGTGTLIRPFAGGTVGFLLASALALAGIAVSNILLPVIVKRRFPDRVGSMTGIYTMALALGTSVAAASTVPLTGALGDNWRIGLVLWATLAAVAVVPWLAVVRTERPARTGATPAPSEAGAARTPSDAPASPANPAAPVATGADAPAPQGALAGSAEPGSRRITRSPTAWSLAVFFGLQATGAYITMGWMPQIFRDAGVSASTAGVLLALTMALGVPLSFVLPQLASRLRHQGVLVVVLGSCGLVGYTGLWLAPAAGAWAWALLLGISNCAFSLALTMIGMRARSSAGVVRLSAFAQSVGYLISIPGPLLVGVLYQHTGGWDLPIILMAGLLIPQIAAGVLAGRDRTVEDEI